MFSELDGVSSVESGYAGGDPPNPSYKEVCGGKTGHAEVIKISFDPSRISRADLLRVFFVAHDPTQLNRQGNDIGHQYRSVVFFTNSAECDEARAVRDEISELYEAPIVTTFEELKNYSAAEDYHQGYFDRFETGNIVTRATMNAGYCSAVIAPKVAKFRKAFAAKLKKSHSEPADLSN